MKTQDTFLILLLAVGLIGCSRQREPRHIVILPDVSGSIERESVEQAFKAIDELVGQLRRGDRIAIIPILGDAQAEASGQIIRFEVPKERQAYDADLQSFRHKLTAALAQIEADALSHPGSKTDILGSIALAEQEFRASPLNSSKELIILSDFIQEDTDMDFRSDRRLINPIMSKKFGIWIANERPNNLKGVLIYLGMLRSKEYVAMSRNRRNALEEFWTEYTASCGGQPISFTDGFGVLESLKKH